MVGKGLPTPRPGTQFNASYLVRTVLPASRRAARPEASTGAFVRAGRGPPAALTGWDTTDCRWYAGILTARRHQTPTRALPSKGATEA